MKNDWWRWNSISTKVVQGPLHYSHFCFCCFIFVGKSCRLNFHDHFVPCLAASSSSSDLFSFLRNLWSCSRAGLALASLHWTSQICLHKVRVQSSCFCTPLVCIGISFLIQWRQLCFWVDKPDFNSLTCLPPQVHYSSRDFAASIWESDSPWFTSQVSWCEAPGVWSAQAASTLPTAEWFLLWGPLRVIYPRFLRSVSISLLPGLTFCLAGVTKPATWLSSSHLVSGLGVSGLTSSLRRSWEDQLGCIWTSRPGDVHWQCSVLHQEVHRHCHSRQMLSSQALDDQGCPMAAKGEEHRFQVWWCSSLQCGSCQPEEGYLEGQVGLQVEDWGPAGQQQQQTGVARGPAHHQLQDEPQSCWIFSLPVLRRSHQRHSYHTQRLIATSPSRRRCVRWWLMLQAVDLRKAAGPNGISGCMLKDCADQQAGIYYQSLSQSIIPSSAAPSPLSKNYLVPAASGKPKTFSKTHTLDTNCCCCLTDGTGTWKQGLTVSKTVFIP